MNLTDVTDFLVEQGEFVDEKHISVIRSILSVKNQQEQKDDFQTFFEKEFPDIIANDFLTEQYPSLSSPTRISIMKSFEKNPNKRTVSDFVQYFNIRFRSMEKLLRQRAELSGLTTISRAKGKDNNDTVAIIGMILEKTLTKNGHYILTLEDPTGTIKVLINKDNKDIIDVASDLCLDEIIGVAGNAGNDIIFSKTIVLPEVPLSKELRRSPYDNNVVFLSDIHFGAGNFLTKEFHRFLLWLNGKLGTLEQRKAAKKVKYVVIAGDVIEGIGIYPDQENDLAVKDIKGQYDLAAKYFSKIPSHIKIIICPGNHDVGRIAEPQLPIPKKYAPSLYELPNIIMVSNPALISLDVSDDFPGINVLMYHGGSLPYYADQVPSIRANGGMRIADDIMVYLLKRRHLAPTHGATLYVPDVSEDPLLIDPVPDIFVTGHIHRAQSKNYRNVTCINSSSWTSITEYQEKMSLEPQPGRIFIVSLKTREVKLMNFSSQKDARTLVEFKRLNGIDD